MTLRSTRLGSLCTLLLLGNPWTASADFTAAVSGVEEGDTIIVMHNGQEEHIRFNGIDCPETGQAFGSTAKQFTFDAVQGKDVTIKEHGKDKYGRTIVDVLLPDGSNLNRQLVKEGLAWWYWK